MQKITLAVFDMAGTVVNENNVVYKTLQRVINSAGYNNSLDFVLEHGAGKEKHQAIKDILKAREGKNNDSLAASLFVNFKKELKLAYENLEVSSYSDVEALMIDLKNKGLKIALNTGYDTKTAQSLLDKMGWVQGREYDVLVTADDVENGRPNPDMILKAMEYFEIMDASKVLKAGDSIIDIEEGKNANCGITVGVTTGAHTRQQLESANPTYVLDQLIELKSILV
jgi:phosphonatase-like hydrolase